MVGQKLRFETPGGGAYYEIEVPDCATAGTELRCQCLAPLVTGGGPTLGATDIFALAKSKDLLDTVIKEIYRLLTEIGTFGEAHYQIKKQDPEDHIESHKDLLTFLSKVNDYMSEIGDYYTKQANTLIDKYREFIFKLDGSLASRIIKHQGFIDLTSFYKPEEKEARESAMEEYKEKLQEFLHKIESTDNPVTLEDSTTYIGDVKRNVERKIFITFKGIFV